MTTQHHQLIFIIKLEVLWTLLYIPIISYHYWINYLHKYFIIILLSFMPTIIFMFFPSILIHGSKHLINHYENHFFLLKDLMPLDFKTIMFIIIIDFIKEKVKKCFWESNLPSILSQMTLNFIRDSFRIYFLLFSSLPQL